MKRLTIILTKSTNFYFVITEITKFTDELKKATKVRILSQINEKFKTYLKNYKFYFVQKSSTFIILIFFVENSKTIFEKNESNIEKNLSSILITFFNDFFHT